MSVSEKLHLYYGGKTRCGQWLTPDTHTTVSVTKCDCLECVETYALALEGDSDNPLRVAAADKVWDRAAALSPDDEQEKQS